MTDLFSWCELETECSFVIKLVHKPSMTVSSHSSALASIDVLFGGDTNKSHVYCEMMLT